MDGWMDGWMDAWMDAWLDGWMDGWMDGLISIKLLVGNIPWILIHVPLQKRLKTKTN